jgi:hypothetical protein
VEKRLALGRDADLIRHPLGLELGPSGLERPGRVVDVDAERPSLAVERVGAVALGEPAGEWVIRPCAPRRVRATDARRRPDESMRLLS